MPLPFVNLLKNRAVLFGGLGATADSIASAVLGSSDTTFDNLLTGAIATGGILALNSKLVRDNTSSVLLRKGIVGATATLVGSRILRQGNNSYTDYVSEYIRDVQHSVHGNADNVFENTLINKSVVNKKINNYYLGKRLLRDYTSQSNASLFDPKTTYLSF